MKALREKIEQLIKDGYEIHLPGGKGKNGSNAVMVVIPGQLQGTSEQVFVVVPYKPLTHSLQKRNKKSRRHPRFEYPIKIAIRETREETGIYLVPDSIIEIDNKSIEDNRPGRNDCIHRKHIMIADRYNAQKMRRSFSPGEPTLGVPFLITLSLLEEYICSAQKWCLHSIKTYSKFRSNTFPLVGLKTRTFHKEVVRTLVA